MPLRLSRRLVGWILLSGAVVFVVVVSALLVDNNFSLRRISRGDFVARLDRSIGASTTWLAAHKEVFSNPPIMFMVIDMARLSNDSRLQGLVDGYRQSRFTTSSRVPFSAVWARMVDSQATVPMFDLRSAPDIEVFEILWDAHAIAPDRVLISDFQRTSMFSRTKYWWGARQHQLLSLDIYRHYNGGSPSLDSTINHLAEKVARDAHFDARLNDSYPQRSAFVLAGGRPDLIRRRWIEKVIESQRPDGSWSYCWHGWCKGLFEFSTRGGGSDHTTVQAAWLLYMLKYRYPQWIEENYR